MARVANSVGTAKGLRSGQPKAHALAVLAVTVAAMVAGTLLMLETLATAKQREETLELAAARLH